MQAQTETYRAAMNGTLERHFSDMIAVIPTRITIDQLKQRLETISTKVDELKIVYSDETSLIVELHLNEKVIPYELHIDETDDPEEYKMYNRQDSTIVDRTFEDAAFGTEIFTRTLFVGDVLSCFFHQLQFLWHLAPDLLFVIDSSAAMKVISRNYIEYHVENELLPDIPDLYVIHSVYEDDTEGEPTQYWFHTHGLLRTGVTEIELIIPNRISSYYGIGDLFQTFANNAVENGQVPMNEPIVIAHSQQGSIHTVAVPWEKGLSYIGHKTSMDQLSSIEDEEMKIQPIDAQNVFLGGWMTEMNTINLHLFSCLNVILPKNISKAFSKNTRKLQGSCSIKQIVKRIVWLIMRKILSGISATFFTLSNRMKIFVFSLSLVSPTKREKVNTCGLKCKTLRKI